MNDPKWELIVEEYRFLRKEEINKMEKQYTILSLGVGGIGLLIGIAFEKNSYPIFMILPLIILLSMSLFDAEREAIKNIGDYLYSVEKNILGLEGFKGIKGWERWLKPRRKPYQNYDRACFAILFIFYFACVFGIYALSVEEQRIPASETQNIPQSEELNITKSDEQKLGLHLVRKQGEFLAVIYFLIGIEAFLYYILKGEYYGNGK